MLTGWNEHGHAVKTSTDLDRQLAELQDASDCGYAPVALLRELGVDYTHGDPQIQYRDGRITLTSGVVLHRGGALGCVWAVVQMPKVER